jgi:hypothetical protein
MFFNFESLENNDFIKNRALTVKISSVSTLLGDINILSNLCIARLLRHISYTRPNVCFALIAT